MSRLNFAIKNVPNELLFSDDEFVIPYFIFVIYDLLEIV